MGSASVGGGREPEGGSKVVGQVGMIAVPELDSPCVSFLSSGLGNRCSRGCVEASVVAAPSRRTINSGRCAQHATALAPEGRRGCEIVIAARFASRHSSLRTSRGEISISIWFQPIEVECGPSTPTSRRALTCFRKLRKLACMAGKGTRAERSATAGRHGEALTRVISSGLFCRDDRI